MVRHSWSPFRAFGMDTGERKARPAGQPPPPGGGAAWAAPPPRRPAAAGPAGRTHALCTNPYSSQKSLPQSIQTVLSALILFFISSPALGRCPLCESISLHPTKNPHFAFFRQLSPLSRPILFIKIGATSYTNCIDHFCSATYIYSFCHTNLRQRLLPANPANEKLRYFLCISANRQSRSNSHSSQNHH